MLIGPGTGRLEPRLCPGCSPFHPTHYLPFLAENKDYYLFLSKEGGKGHRGGSCKDKILCYCESSWILISTRWTRRGGLLSPGSAERGQDVTPEPLEWNSLQRKRNPLYFLPLVPAPKLSFPGQFARKNSTITGVQEACSSWCSGYKVASSPAVV